MQGQKRDRRCGRRGRLGVPRRERFHVWETFAGAAVRAILRLTAQAAEKSRCALSAAIAIKTVMAPSLTEE